MRRQTSGWVHFAIAVVGVLLAMSAFWQFRHVRNTVLGRIGGHDRDPGSSDVHVERGVVYTKLRSCTARENALPSRDAPPDASFARARHDRAQGDEPRGRKPVRFRDAATAERELIAIGLLAPTGTPASGRADTTAFEVLVARGRAYDLSVETPAPVAFDALLAALANTSGGALSGLRFARDTPRPRSGSERAIPGYRLLAHDGSRCVAAGARDFGELYDVPSVVGFLNSLARARGRDERFLTLATFPGEARIVSGTPDALRAALARDLLVEE